MSIAAARAREGSAGAASAPGRAQAEPVDPGLDAGGASALHAVWVDARGQVWSAGGNVLSERLDGGLVWRLGPAP